MMDRDRGGLAQGEASPAFCGKRVEKSGGWLAQGETLRRWHQRASIDRVAERCSAPACQ